MQSCPDERSEDGSPGQVAVTGRATSRHPASYFPPASYQLIAFQAVILRILPLCHKPLSAPFQPNKPTLSLPLP